MAVTPAGQTAQLRDYSAFLAASPEIESRLIDQPRAFFAIRDYAKHVRFIIHKIKWRQLPLSLSAFIVLGLLQFFISKLFPPAFREPIVGYLLGPLVEETAKLVSLRTRVGAQILGAGFAVIFPLVEAAMYIWLVNGLGILTIGYIILRGLGITLHFYTHFVQAYQLSFFGGYRRKAGSFISAVVIHSFFNVGVSIYMRLF